MNEAAVPITSNMWASMASWFTPAILFCFLNFVIGTIFISSKFKTPHNRPPHQNQPGDDGHNPPQLVRAPSILERVRSFNFSLYGSEHPDPSQTHHADPSQPQLVRGPSILERVRSINFSLYRSEHPDPSQPETHEVDPTHDDDDDHHHHVTRSKSDTTGDGEGPPARKATARMRRAASERSRVEQEEAAEEVDRRRPATTREGIQTASFGEEEGVDAKADDFINRFKQQLKLQRLDSLLRYKDMLNRGSSR